MYYVNDKYELKSLKDVESFLRENVGVWSDIDDFNAYIDKTYGNFSVFNVSYSASETFKSVDEESYYVAYDAYIDDIIERFIHFLDLSGAGEANSLGEYIITKNED